MEEIAGRIKLEKGSKNLLRWEIMLEILCRLPVSSLIRFKLVCKSWRSLFSHPCFIELNQSHQKMGFIADYEDYINGKSVRDLYFVREEGADKETIIHLYERPEINGHMMIDSCNGLVCFVHDSHEIIRIYNPATREFVSLPVNTQDMEVYHIGFGFDSKNKKYKVFRLLSNDSVQDPLLPTRYEVFTLGTNSWRRKENVPYSPSNTWPATARGAIHILFKSLEGGGAEDVDSVFSINISKEDFRVNVLPEQFEEGGPSPFLVELRGYLSLCKIDMSRMCIWTLKYSNEEEQTGSNWIKEYNINLPSCLQEPHLEVLQLPVRNNQMLLRCRGGFCFFNLESNHLRMIDDGGRRFSRAYPYVETLVRPCKKGCFL